MKKALITGISGQDGSYLAEFLLSQSYQVHGIIRRASTFNTERLDHIYEDPHETGARLFLHYGDLADGTGLRRVLEAVHPDEVYNLGAQSSEGYLEAARDWLDSADFVRFTKEHFAKRLVDIFSSCLAEAS